MLGLQGDPPHLFLFDELLPLDSLRQLEEEVTNHDSQHCTQFCQG